jgi:hypothetical protein
MDIVFDASRGQARALATSQHHRKESRSPPRRTVAADRERHRPSQWSDGRIGFRWGAFPWINVLPSLFPSPIGVFC